MVETLVKVILVDHSYVKLMEKLSLLVSQVGGSAVLKLTTLENGQKFQIISTGFHQKWVQEKSETQLGS